LGKKKKKDLFGERYAKGKPGLAFLPKKKGKKKNLVACLEGGKGGAD